MLSGVVTGAGCVNPNVDATLRWAAANHPGKPLMFPESTPQFVAPAADGGAWTAQFLQHIEAAASKYGAMCELPILQRLLLA